MAEITEKDARNLQADDVRCLMNWRDWTDEDLVFGISLQGLLDLYHASAKYVTLESWLEEEKGSDRIYGRIRAEHLLT